MNEPLVKTIIAPTELSKKDYYSRLGAAIHGALVTTVDAHGPLDRNMLPSAMKRIMGNVRAVPMFPEPDDEHATRILNRAAQLRDACLLAAQQALSQDEGDVATICQGQANILETLIASDETETQ